MVHLRHLQTNASIRHRYNCGQEHVDLNENDKEGRMSTFWKWPTTIQEVTCWKRPSHALAMFMSIKVLEARWLGKYLMATHKFPMGDYWKWPIRHLQVKFGSEISFKSQKRESHLRLTCTITINYHKKLDCQTIDIATHPNNPPPPPFIAPLHSPNIEIKNF